MKLISPLVYTTSILPVALLIALAIRSADYYLELPAPAAVAGPILLVGGVAFGCLGWYLFGLERLRHPGIVDHVRHCATPYALLVSAGALWTLASGPGAAVMFAVSVSAGCAASTNALVLGLRRLGGAGSGDAA